VGSQVRRQTLELTHGETSDTFGFTTARPPEHVVTIEVIDKAKKTPIKMRSSLHSSGPTYWSHTDEVEWQG